jgi:thiol:disulfide interchange protein DsbD
MNLLHALATAALLLGGTATAAPVQTAHVEAELVAERNALVPGETNWIALRLKPEPGWHVYWQNPGDSGLATRLQWTLPAGVSAGAIHWPYPHLHSLGELTNYGYGEETLHLVPLTVTAEARGSLRLSALAKWLVCADICIPGQAELSLDRPVRPEAAPDPRWTAAFARARAQLPQPAPGWQARYAVEGADFSLALGGPGLPLDAKLQFFPLANDLVNHAAPQRYARDADGLRLSQALSAYFVEAPVAVEGVLVAEQPDGTRAYQIRASAGTVAPVPLPAPAPVRSGLALILLMALAGGLILNLMPCVFPVLSLKALSVLKGTGQDAPRRRAHALAYTAGVILSCMAVAGLLLALRAGGEAIGWGFQLQSPVFVGVLAYLLFALGLSLSGAVHLGTGLMGLGQSLTRSGGLGGSFFTGVLATVVATPCTAPFMGTALGFALTQPAAVSLLVFALLGLGLALPFLLLGFIPQLARVLPRPGAWMETFKQLMAFPLYLSAVWLVWVAARQTDANGAALLLLGLVLIAFALWLWPRRGLAGRLLRWAALAGALALLAHPALAPRDAAAAVPAENAAWEPYSDARLAELRAAGRTVFVNFTADWCITCKLNERVSIESARVQRAFRAHDVAWLVGDWTRADPAISAVLARYGHPGVPLYLVSRAGAEPQVLPQVLSPDLLIQAIEP